MTNCTTNLHLALLILYSMPHLSVGSELKILKQFCMNSGDCFHLIARVTQGGGGGKVLIDPVSWDDAFTKCRSLGGRLAVVNNQHVQEEIENQFTTVDHDVLNADGNKHAWIAGRKDDKWRWIDGREHSESQIRFNRTGQDSRRCAVATHDAGLHAYTCESEVPNYICTFKYKDCSGDPLKTAWQGQTCSGIYPVSRHWPDARRACLAIGGDLFTLLPTYDGYSLRYIANGDQEAWIGLQRGVWQWVVPRDGSQTKESTPMQYWNWAEGESFGDGEQCIYMDLRTRARWRDKACHYSTYFICENILPRTRTTTTTTTGPSIPPPSPSVTWPRSTVSQTTRKPATVLQTAPVRQPVSTTPSNEIVSNGNPNTLSSSSAPSESGTTLIAVTAVLVFIVVIVVVGFMLKFRWTKGGSNWKNSLPNTSNDCTTCINCLRANQIPTSCTCAYMGSQMKILQKENAQLRRSESGNPSEDVRPENSNPLPAISTSSESTDNNGLYTGLGPRDPPSTTPSVYNNPYAEVGDVPPYANLPGGVL